MSGFLSRCTGRLAVTVRTHLALPPPFSPRTAVPSRPLHRGPRLCAGHNKWSKVKHIKGPKDEARARMFMKFSLMIKIAVKEGGSNPEFNLALANVVEQCRGKNMPKVSIEAAIRGAERSRVGSQVTYEVRGPGGCLLLVEVLTDNNTRTHQDIKHLLIKHGGALCDGARHNFDRKGVVRARGGVASERALELAVEAGAEDVMETQDDEEGPLLQFVCGVTCVSAVRAALEERDVCTLTAGLEFLSHTPRLLPPAQLDAAAGLLHALNLCPDVVRVWDNIQADH